MSTICGHDREALKWALSKPGSVAGYWSAEDEGQGYPKANALREVHDPAKLADLLVARGQELGLSIQLRLLVQDGEWPDFEILYFPNEHVATASPKIGFYDRKAGKNWDLTVTQARALLATWIELQDGSKDAAIETMQRAINE
jgi:hypothetical protein